MTDGQLCRRVKELSDLETAQTIPYLYIEDTNATPTDNANIITELANKVHADCIVAAKSNKVRVTLHGTHITHNARSSLKTFPL